MGLKLASLAMTARLPKSVVDFNNRAGDACSINRLIAQFEYGLAVMNRSFTWIHDHAELIGCIRVTIYI
jgi:hypothetical protein